MKKSSKILSLIAVTVLMMIGMVASVFAAEVTPTEMYYGNEALASYDFTYSNENVLPSSWSYFKTEGVIVPVTVSKAGTLRVVLNAKVVVKDVEAGLYSDAACTNKIGSTVSLSVGAISSEGYMAVSNPGTYYLRVCCDFVEPDAVYSNTVNVQTGLYTNEVKTIKSGQTINFYKGSYSEVFTFKYVATQTGTITVNLPYEYGSYVTLYNSKKVKISDKEWVSDLLTTGTKQVFAVQKGKTYYIEVDSNGNSPALQSISVTSKKVKEKSGASKKKAVTIKKNKTSKGTVACGTGKADWYKFKLTKNKKLEIYLDGQITGGLKITVYTSGGKQIGTATCTGTQVKLYTIAGVHKKGTYYIKIQRNSTASGGSYNLKWK